MTLPLVPACPARSKKAGPHRYHARRRDPEMFSRLTRVLRALEPDLFDFDSLLQVVAGPSPAAGPSHAERSSHIPQGMQRLRDRLRCLPLLDPGCCDLRCIRPCLLQQPALMRSQSENFPKLNIFDGVF